MLPVSTLPKASVYGSGMVPIAKKISTGVRFGIARINAVWTGRRILLPLLGLA
jgi:hypothetical protein